MSSFFFAPYGVLPGEYKEKGEDLNIVMQDWKEGDSDRQRIGNFNKWREERLDEIADAVWPCYDKKSKKWAGKATGFAKDLTEFEIRAMIDRYFGASHVLDTKPAPELATEQMEPHREHYEYEDKDAPGINYRQYDETLTIEEEKAVLAIMLSAVTTKKAVGKKAAGHFWFKSQLQRPRPLHAAMMFGLGDGFVSELSARGQHPSIVSGHCFQGILMGCAVLESWLDAGKDIERKRRLALGQFMVDMGDRRVFAGVHYPSDNIASWILAMSIIPKVFDHHEEIASFCRYAIREQSAVYDLVKTEYVKESSAEAAMNLLAKYNLDPRD